MAPGLKVLEIWPIVGNMTYICMAMLILMSAKSNKLFIDFLSIFIQFSISLRAISSFQMKYADM